MSKNNKKTCPECGKKFDNLGAHMKAHENSKDYDLSNLGGVVKMVEQSDKSEIKRILLDYIKKDLLSNYVLNNKYKIVYLIESGSNDDNIDRLTLDRIYSSLSSVELNEKEGILLIINSSGGEVEPAYLISKVCREYSNDKFSISIPRRAKSAATLISLGGDEIHMGDISELGPIDPQIRKLPALALKDSVSYLAEMSEKYPDSSEMFAKFLAQKLDLQELGHFERVAESTIDYAIRLLKKSGIKKDKRPQDVAEHFVKKYKDHGFVIDKEESAQLLGDMIKTHTKEYMFADELYQFLERVELGLYIVNNQIYNISLVGGLQDLLIKKRESRTQKEK